MNHVRKTRPVSTTILYCREARPDTSQSVLAVRETVRLRNELEEADTGSKIRGFLVIPNRKSNLPMYLLYSCFFALSHYKYPPHYSFTINKLFPFFFLDRQFPCYHQFSSSDHNISTSSGKRFINMSQSLDGHPNQGSSSSSVKSMGSSPPVAANSLSAPNSTSYPGTETPIINSQNRGYEESQDGLPASLSQEGVSDRGGQSDLTLGDVRHPVVFICSHPLTCPDQLARQTKLLASHYDKLSGHVAIFGRRLHDLHDAINLVMERQSPEDHNNPRSFATDPAKWAHDADFYGIYLWFLRSERDHGRRIEPGDSPLAEACRFRYTFDSLYHNSNPVRPQTLCKLLLSSTRSFYH
jgi:hypothetical protein